MLLKREDLNHTGAHKINNTVGQALLARRMGKRRIIAETGAGTARRRDRHRVRPVRARVRGVHGRGGRDPPGAQRVPHAAARRDGGPGRVRAPARSRTRPTRRCATGSPTCPPRTTSSARWSGPDPYPRMVRDFQSVIGREARAQMLERIGATARTRSWPAWAAARNAIGIFTAFLDDAEVELVGVEAAGEGLESGHHSATLSAGTPGVLHGSLSYLLQDADGQVAPAHSVSAGLDYPGVGPEHSWLRDTGRVRYESATDGEALDAFQALCRLEGIIPALETAHAIAWVRRSARALGRRRSRCWCASAGGATRTWPTWPRCSGAPRDGGTAVRPPPRLPGRGADQRPGARRSAPSTCTSPTIRSTSERRTTCGSAFSPIWAVLDELVLHRGRDRFRVGGAGRLPPAQQEREPRVGTVQGRDALAHASGVARSRRS